MRIFAGLLLLSLGLMPLAAAPVRNGAVTVELVSSIASVQPGKPFTVALRLEHKPHWHTYWINAGTGYPTSLTWTLPPGWTAGDIQWPVPHLIQDAQGKVTGHGYDGVIFLLVTLTPPANAPFGPVTLKAKGEWLMCEEMCMPGEANLQLTVPMSLDTPQPDPTWSAKIAEATAQLPVALPSDRTAAAVREAKSVVLTLTLPGTTELKSPHFFSADGFIAYDEPQQVDAQGTRLTLTLPISPDGDAKTAALDGVLAYTNSQGGYTGLKLHLPFHADPNPLVPEPKSATPTTETPTKPSGGAAGGTGFFATLGLAFLGSLILNLMPCVFPVLGIKVLGFVNQSGHAKAKVVQHGLVFALGVLLSFWALAGALLVLRAGGAQLGWGFQLQSPTFVFGMAVFLLIFALNLSGLFEIGLSATGVGGSLQMKEGLAGSFFTGALATLVATPCSAPFLAPALGAALSLPSGQSFLVFTAIALGLALPYLLLSIFPAAVKFLPKPGAWMETFKQLMAFPLYATVGWLLWVLAGQTKDDDYASLFISFGFVLVAMAAWAYGRFGQAHGKPARRIFGHAFAALLLVFGLATGWPKTAPAAVPGSYQVSWEKWSPQAITAAQATGKFVYVDFTARWCATCQTNKAAVFHNDEVLAELQKRNVVLLRGDWTNRDPAITAELARWNRSAVPFNLIYAPGKTDPLVLPELLTPGTVLKAFRTL